MTLTREQIEAACTDIIQGWKPNHERIIQIRDLALEALDKQGLEVKDSADYLVEALDQQEIEELRAENDRLQRERDEALAEAKHWVSISVLLSIDGMIEEIEKRARAKAIDEALEVYRTQGEYGMEWHHWETAERAILALRKRNE